MKIVWIISQPLEGLGVIVAVLMLIHVKDFMKKHPKNNLFASWPSLS
jgi:hypothetical protein